MKISEIPDEKLNVNEQILQIARRKSRACLDGLKTPHDRPFLVLGADTEVVFEGKPLGKPSSPDDAIATLRRLSGRAHEVKTALCLIETVELLEASHVETTKVFFKELSENAIRDYVATGDPMDKAGSYGIQSGAGHLIEKIEGPYDNVVGLPVDAFRKLLNEKGWRTE